MAEAAPDGWVVFRHDYERAKLGTTETAPLLTDAQRKAEAEGFEVMAGGASIREFPDTIRVSLQVRTRRRMSMSSREHVTFRE